MAKTDRKIVNMVLHYAEQGLSVRKIAMILEKHGFKISKSKVHEILKRAREEERNEEQKDMLALIEYAKQHMDSEAFNQFVKLLGQILSQRVRTKTLKQLEEDWALTRTVILLKPTDDILKKAIELKELIEKSLEAEILKPVTITTYGFSESNVCTVLAYYREDSQEEKVVFKERRRGRKAGE